MQIWLQICDSIYICKDILISNDGYHNLVYIIDDLVLIIANFKIVVSLFQKFKKFSEKKIMIFILQIFHQIL